MGLTLFDANPLTVFSAGDYWTETASDGSTYRTKSGHFLREGLLLIVATEVRTMRKTTISHSDKIAKNIEFAHRCSAVDTQ